MILTARERPDLGLPEPVWPEYNMHGDVLTRFWGLLPERFPDFQFVLAEEEEEVIAEAHSVPLSWDGTIAGLPKGIDGAVERAFGEREAPNTLCALAIEIPLARRGQGLSRRMVEEMVAIAREHGFASLIAPVRPSWKERYPLTPIERYATWRREDGRLFDPWMRVHERLGAEILRPEPESLRITGTVAEWEDWTAMSFPETGEYVFPAGLAVLSVSRDADVGSYWEPNVWMRHATTPA